LLQNSKLQFDDIPNFVHKILQPFPESILYKSKNKMIKFQYKNEEKNVKFLFTPNQSSKKKMLDLPTKFQEKLYNFQKEGVAFGLKNCGRVLIADEMVLFNRIFLI